LQENHLQILAPTDAHIVKSIFLKVDGFGFVTEFVPPHQIVAFRVLVFRGVEERLVIRAPDQRCHAVRAIGKKLARAKILDVEVILAKAARIGGISQQ
jgi:hypothetical protein